MERLLVILNTYKSLGTIPDPDNFEAIVNILEELKFRKEESGTEMTRKEIADWVIQFIKSPEGGGFPRFINVALKLNSSISTKLAKLRVGTNGNMKNFEDDFDDLHNG